MKKFTKGCLITALILFIFGCAFCGIFGVLGGFRQLESRTYSIGWNGIRLGYNGYWFDIWDEDDWDGGWWSDMSDAQSLASGSSKIQTGYRASDITDIDIELGGANLVIEESEDDHIWIENASSINHIKYNAKNGVFKLQGRKHNVFWNEVRGKVYLYLPRGIELDTIDLEVGAGKVESISLEAKEIDLDIGAGTFSIESLNGDKVDINVGAGKADIDSIIARTVSMEVGAGTLEADEIAVESLKMDVGMGNITAEGSITRNADIECGMGNVNMILQGAETDYNYDIECNMGNVKIGNIKCNGIDTERSIDNGSNSKVDVECGMGNIDIDFTK